MYGIVPVTPNHKIVDRVLLVVGCDIVVSRSTNPFAHLVPATTTIFSHSTSV